MHPSAYSKINTNPVMKHTVHALLALCLLVGSSNLLPAQSKLKKANKEYELNAFGLAIKTYREVLAKEPDNVVALSRTADSYLQLNQMDDAIHWYKKALAQKGVDPIHIFNYAKALQAKGDYEKAKQYFLLFAEGQPAFGNHYAANCDFAISLRGIPPIYKIKNEFINTSHSDFGAAIYNNKVVYGSTRKDIGSGASAGSADWAGTAKNQLFLTSRDDNFFMKRPKLLKSELTSNYGESPLAYSGDGKMVAFTKNNFAEGNRQIPTAGAELSIYLAEVSREGDWKNARPFPYNGSGYSSGYPWLSDDGNTMYFASNRPDGFGGYDIYVTYRVGKTWTTPVNLGPVVNSLGNEVAPFLVGESLYFASDWHQGLGGLDIFRAEKTDEQWNRIFHLGNGINSSYDDYGYVYDTDASIGYFTSNRIGGKGHEDIYQFSQATDKIEITVLYAANKSAVMGAALDFSGCDEGVFETNEQGQYDFQALAGLNCEVIVSKKGYKSEAIRVSSTGKRETRRYQVLLTKIAEKFTGRVFNALNNEAIEDAYITATEAQSGRKIEARTNSNGAYKLALMPNTDYILRYSKAGFLDTHKRISTGDGSDKSILGVILFQPAGTSINGEIVTTSIPKPADTAIIPSDTSEGSVDSDDGPQEGYSVQIAAMGIDKPVAESKYAGLKEIGNLYSRPQNGLKKVRIGIFTNREEAESARRELYAKGFDKAFVVREALEEMVDVEFYHDPVDPAPKTAVEEEEPFDLVDVEKATRASTETSPYKVRLASYRNTKYFNRKKVEAFGQIEEKKKGNFTIMLLSGFNNLDAAVAAQKKAIASGFSGAHIVIEDAGRLVKVNM